MSYVLILGMKWTFGFCEIDIKRQNRGLAVRAPLRWVTVGSRSRSSISTGRRTSVYSSLSIQRLSRAGLLPRAADPWPPQPRPLPIPLRLAVATIRPTAAGGLMLCGLPRPDGGLHDVPLERLPFHQSPGRWHWRCPCCGQLKGVMVEVDDSTPRAPLHVRQIGWTCRSCAGLPESRAWPLSPAQRLDNALDRAGEIDRRPGEKARDWRRRRQRATLAIAKARDMDDQTVERLTRSSTLSPPSNREPLRSG